MKAHLCRVVSITPTKTNDGLDAWGINLAEVEHDLFGLSTMGLPFSAGKIVIGSKDRRLIAQAQDFFLACGIDVDEEGMLYVDPGDVVGMDVYVHWEPPRDGGDCTIKFSSCGVLDYESMVSDIAHLVEVAWEKKYGVREPCFTYEIMSRLKSLLGVGSGGVDDIYDQPKVV